MSGIFVAMLKWQNLQGMIAKKQLCISFIGQDSVLNDKNALDVLLEQNQYPAQTTQNPENIRGLCQQIISRANDDFDQLIGDNSSQFLNPSAIEWLCCALNE